MRRIPGQFWFGHSSAPRITGREAAGAYSEASIPCPKSDTRTHRPCLSSSTRPSLQMLARSLSRAQNFCDMSLISTRKVLNGTESSINTDPCPPRAGNYGLAQDPSGAKFFFKSAALRSAKARSGGVIWPNFSSRTPPALESPAR